MRGQVAARCGIRIEIIIVIAVEVLKIRADDMQLAAARAAIVVAHHILVIDAVACPAGIGCRIHHRAHVVTVLMHQGAVSAEAP